MQTPYIPSIYIGAALHIGNFVWILDEACCNVCFEVQKIGRHCFLCQFLLLHTIIHNNIWMHMSSANDIAIYLSSLHAHYRSNGIYYVNQER